MCGFLGVFLPKMETKIVQGVLKIDLLLFGMDRNGFEVRV